jgi:hypothetical protein
MFLSQSFGTSGSSSLRRRRAIGVILTVALLGGGACAAERLKLLDHSVPVPARWQPQPPASNFRLAQFRVPAVAGARDGEMVVFYFGAGQGGSAAANIERWTSQFSTADGKPVTPRRESFEVRGFAVTVVELQGTYARAVGGVNAAPRPDQMLLAAVVGTRQGNVILQLHGDRPTVEENRPAFFHMVRDWR